MYKEKNKTYSLIAIVYWIIYMLGFLIMGVLYKNGIHNYNVIYWTIAIAGILIVIIKDKSITNLGFTKEKLKINLIIAFSIIILSFIISVIVGKYTLLRLIRGSLYFFLYTYYSHFQIVT